MLLSNVYSALTADFTCLITLKSSSSMATLSVLAICVDGTFHRYSFTDKGICNRLEYDMFLYISDDMQFWVVPRDLEVTLHVTEATSNCCNNFIDRCCAVKMRYCCYVCLLCVKNSTSLVLAVLIILHFVKLKKGNHIANTTISTIVSFVAVY